MSSSDLNKKNSIEALSDAYSALFDRLRPVRYKYNNGTSDRYHTGFIAQHVEEAMEDAGLSSKEFAAFARIEEGECYLRYEEFIALCVGEIQALKREKEELDAKMKNLEERLAALEKKGGEPQ